MSVPTVVGCERCGGERDVRFPLDAWAAIRAGRADVPPCEKCGSVWTDAEVMQ